jgi:hypothetical protein
MEKHKPKKPDMDSQAAILMLLLEQGYGLAHACTSGGLSIEALGLLCSRADVRRVINRVARGQRIAGGFAARRASLAATLRLTELVWSDNEEIASRAAGSILGTVPGGAPGQHERTLLCSRGAGAGG